MKLKHRLPLWGVLLVSACQCSIQAAAQSIDVSGGSPCELLEALAQDQAKADYLTRWAETRLQDERFLLLAGPSGRIRRLDSSENAELVGIDWEYLGLDSTFVYIELNRDRTDYLRLHNEDATVSEISDSSKVASITIGYGRAGLIIKRPNQPLGIEWRSALMEAITMSKRDVTVFCR